MKRGILWLFACVAITACAVGGVEKDGATVTAPAPSSFQATIPASDSIHPLPTIEVGPEIFPLGVNPLTGLPVEDTTLLERRPLAVKISNDPRPMRPQWGLTVADIVYEYYTEWAKTRFIGVFYGRDGYEVGPIRSARFFDEHIVRMYKAVLAYVGADDRVLKRFKKAEYLERLVSEFPAGCPPICRFDPKMWNHALTNTRLLSQYITDLGVSNGLQDLRGMRFSSTPPSGGKTVGAVYVRYSPYTYSQWVYDYLGGTYIRLQDRQDDDQRQGEEFDLLNDRLTGEPVDADNVVVILAPHTYFVKKEDAEVMEMDLVGNGLAYLFRDGVSYEVRWLRKTKETLLTLVDENGVPFPFKPGRTWFEIMGETSLVNKNDQGVYRFEFRVP